MTVDVGRASIDDELEVWEDEELPAGDTTDNVLWLEDRSTIEEVADVDIDDNVTCADVPPEAVEIIVYSPAVPSPGSQSTL